jgi:MFS family permease
VYSRLKHSFNWFYGWNVIAITLLFQSLTIGMHFYCFTLWVVPWSVEFGGVVRGNIMIAITLSSLFSGLISPLAGRALDKLPSHMLVCGGALTYAIGLICIAMAQQVWQIVAIYMLVLPIGLVLTGAMAAQTLATRWFTKNRGLAIACSTLGTSVGGFTMPPLAAALLAAFGWRITFVVLGLITALFVIPIAWVVLKRKPPVDEALLAMELDASAPRKKPPTSAALLRDRNFRILVIAFLPLSLTFNAIQMNLGAYAQDINVTQQQAAWLVSQLSILMLVGKILFGKLSDRFDQRSLYWAIAVGMVAAVLIISLSTNYSQLGIGTGVLGFIYAGYLPLIGAIIANRFGTRGFGQAMGLASIFLGLGSAGSFIAAAIRDFTGSYAIAFSVFLIMIIPAAWTVRKLDTSKAYD